MTTAEQRSPCRGCELLVSDKNGPTCLQCPQRLDYVRALGGHLPGDDGHVDPDPVPVPPAPAVGRTNKRYTPWSKDEIEFLRENARSLTDTQLGHELGRSASSVQKTRSYHGIYRTREVTTVPDNLTAAVSTTKTCKVCGEIKTLEEYQKTPQNSDGRAGRCRTCRNKYYRAWLKGSHVRPTAAADPPRARERERFRWGASSKVCYR